MSRRALTAGRVPNDLESTFIGGIDMTRDWRQASLLASVLAIFAGCDGNNHNDDNNSGTEDEVAVLIGDDTIHDLSSLRVTVTDVTLVETKEGQTEKLLDAPVEVDLIGLQNRRALIALKQAGRRGYDEVRLAIDPASVTARDRFGALVSVNVGVSDVAILLKNDLDVQGSELATRDIDVLLTESLRDNGPALDFDLVADAHEVNADMELAELRGRVVDIDEGDERFDVEILPFEGDDISRGRVEVDVNGAIFLDDDGRRLDQVGFFNDLDRGMIVQLHGSLTEGGTLNASSIEIQGRREQDVVARLVGTVIGLDRDGNTLELRLTDVRKGEDIVRDEIGDDPSILVSWKDRTVFLWHDDRRDGPGDEDEDGGGRRHGPASETDLAIGQELDIKFGEFETEPFGAVTIEIQDERESFEGKMVDRSGVPDSMILHLEPYDPAIASGLVASSDTDVLVHLRSARVVFLDLPHEPEVEITDLITDVMVAIRGDLSGTPEQPEMNADLVKVRPGLLRGRLLSFDADTNIGTVSVDTVDEPFGNVTPDGSFQLTDAVRYDGAADGENELNDLFSQRQDGQDVFVQLQGLADDQGRVHLYLIRSELRDSGGDS